MYENNIYSGSGTGSDTTGTFGENGTVKNNGFNENGTGQYSGFSENGTGRYSGFGENGAGRYSGFGENGAGQYGGFHENNGNQYGSYNFDNQQMPGVEPGTGKGGHKKGGYFRKAMVSVSLGLVFGLFAGIGFFAVQQTTNLVQTEEQGKAVLSEGVQNSDNSQLNESKSGISVTETSNIRVVSSDVQDVAKAVMPAMVSIVNNFTNTVTDFFGQQYRQDEAASGSGIIVAESDEELLIVSNYHVVANAKQLDVSFIDGSQAVAQIKGTDSDMDLAVLAIPLASLSQETREAIAIATLGDSDTLEMGEPVVAIGNALGYGQSVTNGIVSALNREITLEDGSTGTFIQTNAAINPGNSGGALLNVKGEVIGINSNKIGGSVVEGMGYAIPISAAKPIIADLMLKQTRNIVEDDQKGYMGITLQTITDQFSQMYKMPQGIYVTGVEEGSPAHQAGLLAGDIIVEFDGEKIASYEDLQEVLQYYAAGTTAKITVKRPQNGEYQTVDMNITLGTRPASTR